MPAENKLREAYKALLDFSAAEEKITANRSQMSSLYLPLIPGIEIPLPLSLEPPVGVKKRLIERESERTSCDMEYQVLRNESSRWPDVIRKSLGLRRIN
jgi:hypothetical protein